MSAVDGTASVKHSFISCRCQGENEGRAGEWSVELTDLEEGLCPRRPRLEHDGEDGEEDDLDGGAARVPVGAADAVLGRHSRGLQQRRRPRPLRHDGGSRQTDTHLGEHSHI